MHLRAAGSAFSRSMQAFMAGRSRKWSSRRPTVAVSRLCPSTNSTVISKARAAGTVRAMALSVFCRCSYPTASPPGLRPAGGRGSACARSRRRCRSRIVGVPPAADLARGAGSGQREGTRGFNASHQTHSMSPTRRGMTGGSDQMTERAPGRAIDLLDHVAIALPDRDEYGDGDREYHEEADPALDPMDVREDGLDMIREEVGEGEGEGHPEHGGQPIGEEEFPEGDACDPCREKGGSAEAGDVTRGHDGLHRVPAIRALEATLAGGSEEPPHGTRPQHSLSAVASCPVQDHVAREHSQDADEQARPGRH